MNWLRDVPYLYRFHFSFQESLGFTLSNRQYRASHAFIGYKGKKKFNLTRGSSYVRSAFPAVVSMAIGE